MKVTNRIHVSQLLAPPPGASIWLHSTGYLTGHGDCRFVFSPAVHVGPHLITKGEGVVRCLGRERRVVAGDMFCLLPGVRIEYFEDATNPWEYAWLHLVGAQAVDFARGCGFDRETPWRRARDPEAVAVALGRLRNAVSPPEAHPFKVLSLLYDFARLCGADMRSGGAATRHGGLVARAKLLIDSCLHTPINIAEIARGLGVGRTTLYNAFREELGTTPIDYLRDARLERAREHLRSSDRTLAAIAASSGFANVKYFMRCFREAEGMTPTEWRGRVGKGRRA